VWFGKSFLGQADKAFDVLRQNAAIGWMMLTMVEGIVRSEGGVGTILLDQNHHFRLAAVFAIQLTILMLGLLQDYGIGMMKNLLCPYAALAPKYHHHLPIRCLRTRSTHASLRPLPSSR